MSEEFVQLFYEISYGITNNLAQVGQIYEMKVSFFSNIDFSSLEPVVIDTSIRVSPELELIGEWYGLTTLTNDAKPNIQTFSYKAITMGKAKIIVDFHNHTENRWVKRTSTEFEVLQ